MLEGSDAQTLDTPPADDAVQAMRDLIERLQGEIRFEKTRNEALNFEIARLKRWRFGSSSESLEASTQAVLFDFTASRAGEHPWRVLQPFGGTLGSDDYSGYFGLQAQGVTAALCWAHARRKLFEAHKFNGSEIAGQAGTLIAKLYEVEREARELQPEARWLLRQQRSRPIVDALHSWLTAQRQVLAKADITAKAIDYSLSHWRALTRYLDDGNVPIDNNAAENAVRPLCVGRKNWLFVGSQQAGERAAVVLSLIESAKLNGHDPWAYLKDAFERLPTLKQRDLGQLLPHNRRPAGDTAVPNTALAEVAA